MELTPNEIRNQKFAVSMRGYNRSEVDAFKNAAAAVLEEAKVAYLKLAEEKESLALRYQELKNLEETIKAAVVEAQKGAETTLSNAKKESELIIAEARRRRDDAIEQKYRKLAEAEARLEELEFTRRSFYIRLKADLGVHLKLLDTMNPEAPEKETKEKPRLDEFENDIDRIVEQFRLETGAPEEKKDEPTQNNDI
ncbi:MAG: DivIVA domain-containing protein [candidate division Zixibacteria bacterium]|nr:DivIVA domain-containing protein [candidate division Zixibacteria bacterium]